MAKTSQQEYLKKFRKVLDEMYKTTEAKNHDYATDNDAFRNFRMFGAVGILVRMSDKLSRLTTAIWEKRTFKVVAEKVRDTAIDLAVYAIILVLYLEEEE